MAKRSKGYEVGYGKPPVSGRFKKGQSGNSRGRERGSKNAATLLAEGINQPFRIKEGGRTKQVTRLEAAIDQMAEQAARGDPRATKFIFDMLHKFGDKMPGAKAAGFEQADHQVIEHLLARLRASVENRDAPNNPS
jgi:Family of unknown function (DUF5681)